MSRRDFILSVLDNKESYRVPVGFWFHFVPDGLLYASQETIEKNLEGHKAFFEEFQPDFLKLMSDGFFIYPNETIAQVKQASDLDQVTASHPEQWIQSQVDLVKKLTDLYGKEIVTFYNIFSPANYLAWGLSKGELGKNVLPEAVKQNPDGVKHALDEIAKDISILTRRVIEEGGTDGIYLSVRNIEGLDRDAYHRIVAPSELSVLAAANELSEYNLLHICGYEGYRNDLSFYKDYPAKAINWAVTTEGVSLRDGKELFGERTVIGGFDHTKNGVLYKGCREEIEAETVRILESAGSTGVILGADCTVPSDIPISHLRWVREKARQLAAARGV